MSLSYSLLFETIFMPSPTLYLFLFTALFLPAFTIPISAQSPPGVQNFFAARRYDDYVGEARIAMVRQLEGDNWSIVDSIYNWTEPGENTVLKINQRDLTPFVNEQGDLVYWVADVAPQFPGGQKAIQQYMRDVIGPSVSGPDDEVQNSVYIRCTIGVKGDISEVAEAQRHADWIPVETIAQCLDAVRYMPAWSPGIFKGQPVRVCVLVEVALKE